MNAVNRRLLTFLDFVDSCWTKTVVSQLTIHRTGVSLRFNEPKLSRGSEFSSPLGASSEIPFTTNVVVTLSIGIAMRCPGVMYFSPTISESVSRRKFRRQNHTEIFA